MTNERDYTEGYFDGKSGKPTRYKGEIARLEVMKKISKKHPEQDRCWGFVVYPDGSQNLIIPKQKQYSKAEFTLMLTAIGVLESAMFKAERACEKKENGNIWGVRSRCCRAKVVDFQGGICRKCGIYCKIVRYKRASR